MKSRLVGILMIIVILIMIIPSVSFADYTGIDTDITIGESDAASSSRVMTNRIVGTLQVIGTVVSVVALIIIGIRYMLSSVEEKAQMKGVIGYYITGCVLVFATSNVIAFAYNIINDVSGKHEWKYVRTETYATCTVSGIELLKCESCGEEREREIPALGHRTSSWKIETAATCKNTGLKIKECTRNGCGIVLDKETIPSSEHSLELVKTIDASCLVAKQVFEYCSICEETFKRYEGSALGHDYIKTEKEGTCIKNRTITQTCNRCSLSETIEEANTKDLGNHEKRVEGELRWNGRYYTQGMHILEGYYPCCNRYAMAAIRGCNWVFQYTDLDQPKFKNKYKCSVCGQDKWDL